MQAGKAENNPAVIQWQFVFLLVKRFPLIQFTNKK